MHQSYNSVLPISYRYRCRYLHVADLSISVVGIYGCVADVTRTCMHMVQCSFASLLPEFSHVVETPVRILMAKRSKVWQYFTFATNDIHKATCNICETAVSRGGVRAKAFTTTNLRSHLSTHHPEQFKELEHSTASVSILPLNQLIGIGYRLVCYLYRFYRQNFIISVKHYRIIQDFALGYIPYHRKIQAM